MMLVDSVLPLRIARLNPPQVFYRFGFLRSSYLWFLYIPHFTLILLYDCVNLDLEFGLSNSLSC